MNNIVVIVDAFSTGKYLAPEINNRGYKCVHVKSRFDIPDYFTEGYRVEDFLAEFVFANNMQDLNFFLSKYNVIAVINGTETGVELTDLIASSLKLSGNNPSTSHLRRNKFDMIEAIAKAGLYAAKQNETDNIDDLLNWYCSNFSYGDRVVIKPVNSAGTDNVSFCHNESEIKNAALAILSQVNRLGLKNDTVLAQSYLEGHDEYVVNSVSHAGKHHITDIWHCDKVYIPGAGIVPGCETLLPFSGVAQDLLKSYVFEALDVLNFTQGPAHFELKMTPHGVAIVEVGARVQGGVNPSVHFECMGTSQLIKTVDVYLNIEKFFTYQDQGYQLQKYSRWIDLISKTSGIVKGLPIVDHIRSMKSYYSMNANLKVGDMMHRTVDLFTSPGDIYLIHNDADLLKSEFKKIRELELNGGYEIISSD